MSEYERVQRIVAAFLDHPNIFMGGPSQGNLRRADDLLSLLGEEVHSWPLQRVRLNPKSSAY
jgi:hypothetical protein